jgi:hypothetical protein
MTFSANIEIDKRRQSHVSDSILSVLTVVSISRIAKGLRVAWAVEPCDGGGMVERANREGRIGWLRLAPCPLSVPRRMAGQVRRPISAQQHPFLTLTGGNTSRTLGDFDDCNESRRGGESCGTWSPQPAYCCARPKGGGAARTSPNLQSRLRQPRRRIRHHRREIAAVESSCLS